MKLETVERPTVQWQWLLPTALVVAFVFWNPVGYVGGGADDDRYIAGATCWLAHGPCLPVNHWEGRWPVVGALAISAELFGFSRFSLALPFVLASLTCLYFLKHIGDRLFHSPVGMAGALIFGLLPVFAIQAMSATVEPIEMAFVLACFTALVNKRLLIAGLALGLAFQTRETSIAALLPAMALQWRNWKGMALFAAGFGAPLIIEFAVFYVSTGDPLYRRTLSVSHTLIPSSELKVRERGLPFFSSSLMQNWKYEPGVSIHWVIDGFANLFVNLKTGFLFILSPLLVWLYRARLNERERKITAYAIGSSFFYVAVLIYGLSIDPKPRTMYIPLAGLSFALGLVAVRAWNLVFAVTFATVVPLMALVLIAQPRHLRWERAAERMLAEHLGLIETSQPGYFFFNPELSKLPPIGSGKPYLLVTKSKPCKIPSNEDPMDVGVLSLVAEKRGEWLADKLDYPWRVCLFRYAGARPPVSMDKTGPWRRRVDSRRWSKTQP